MKTRLLLAAACSLWMTHAVAAAEIRILASGAMKEIVLELLPEFERHSGNRVATSWAGSADIRKRIGAAEPFDLVIVGAADVEAFIKAGRMAPGSRVDIARSGVGVAVQAGASRPDISSSEAVKATLLSARAVAFSTGPSGAHVLRLFDRFGIAEAMKDKSKQTPPGVRVAEYLSGGEADLGFQQVSEFIHEKGIDYLGPLPADIQHITEYSSGIPATSTATESAKALQAFLSAPAAASVIRKNGMEPGRP